MEPVSCNMWSIFGKFMNEMNENVIFQFNKMNVYNAKMFRILFFELLIQFKCLQFDTIAMCACISHFPLRLNGFSRYTQETWNKNEDLLMMQCSKALKSMANIFKRNTILKGKISIFHIRAT